MNVKQPCRATVPTAAAAIVHGRTGNDVEVSEGVHAMARGGRLP